MEFIGAYKKVGFGGVKVGCDPSRFLEARRKKPYPLVHVSSTADLTLILLGVFGLRPCIRLWAKVYLEVHG